MKIINWILYSSANANKYSLTVKGFATFVPTIVLFLGFFNLRVEEGSLLALIDSVAIVITAIGTAITALATLWGIIRKIGTTALGSNAVLKR